MKKLFSILYRESILHFWLLVLRVSVSAFMLSHGIPKFMKVLQGDMTFADPFGLGAATSLILVVFAEAICSVFIILGLGTRLAVIPPIIAMLVAAFVQHSEDAFAKKELALLYMLVYFTLLILGSGKYSLDKVLFKAESVRRRY